MFDDPKMISALVGAIVSLIISAIAGAYTLAISKKRFENLKKEIISKSSAEKFVNAKDIYLDAYKKFQLEASASNKRNSVNATETGEIIMNFFAEYSRDFYTRHKQFLSNNQLELLLKEINKGIELNIMGKDGKNDEKRNYINNILMFCNQLNETALDVG